MKALCRCFILLTGLLLPSFAAESKIAAEGATLQKLVSDCSFTEGPASDAEGNVLFTDQPNDRILKWGIDGKLTTYLQPCGRANGLCFDRQGNLWACADEKNEMWRIEPSGKKTVVITECQSKLLNGPNDVWVQPDGGVYFTDPYYKRPYWQRAQEKIEQCVYHIAPDGNKAVRVIDSLKQPNGIIGTADNKTLYVADIGDGKTYRFSIQKDGTVKDKHLFCQTGSDGMTIDSEGNIYLTGKGVFVFDKTGKQIEHIEVPEGWTANVCFGGHDRDILFITASKSLYSLKTRVKGVDSQ